VTIDTTPYPGLTLLHIACRQKDQEIINYLVAQGAYVAPELEQFIETYAAGECQALGSFYTDRTSFNEFVYGAELDSLQRLFVAAQLYGCRDAASCLRQILLTNDLHCACSEGNLARVKQLFEKGVLVDGRDRQKKTALHQACLAGYLDIVKYLFGRGAQLNPIDIDGNTPVYWACFEGNFAIVQYLVEKGVRVDKDKRLLEVSLQSIKPDSEKSLLAKFLINHGARIAPEIAVEYQEILGQIPQNQVAQKI
jgi:ankyrin repeat protein